ncbi:MAG: xanthine dehydrogenase family protein subunit M [Gammaproteobacteria bacterium]|nr:xanthine dehydrogenase family protein subunit M [Gammaproteobacteria bacterium]
MQYEAPQTTADAVSLLAKTKGSVHVLAGGSDLLVRMKGGFVEPDLIVDIKRIKAMNVLKKTTEGFLVGAAVPCAQLAQNKAFAKAWPGVVEAANLIGSDQIQGRCTMVGNLCNASPAADSVPALIAANAQAIIQGPRGERRVPVEKIGTAPGKTSLKKGEVVESLLLPPRAGKSGDAYLRFIPRTEMDIAVVSAGVNLVLGKKAVIEDAHVSLGAVAATALRVKAAGKALVGTTLDDEVLEKLADICASACSPIDDKRGTVAFRIKVARVLAKRAAKIAYQRAGGK